jgi:hypothetical protein
MFFFTLTHRLGFRGRPSALLVLVALLAATSGRAQEKTAAEPYVPHSHDAAPADSLPTAPAPSTTPQKLTHRFWDTQNRWLFAGVAAVRALDGTSTRNFRRRGRSEGLLTNDIVDNAPLFAAIEFAATAASIGTSYWMHRTGHHKLERWVSYIHIGVGAFGDARNYALKSIPRPATVP